MTILIVEDEESLRAPIAKLLRRRGCVVFETADGNTAIDLFRNRAGEIDVVLLDVTLPDVSGADLMVLMALIRPDIKVILTSGHAREAVMGALRGQRPAAYIRKPYTSSQLTDLLRATCCAKPRANSA